jgi:rod shape-determining protein MreD
MNNDSIKYGSLLILLPILQISIFNNINLLGYINPFVYIIFIFVFPIRKNKSLLLISSFILGLFVDFLTNDGGIHTFSLVFIAFIRIVFLKLVTGKSKTDLEEQQTRNISFSILMIWIIILTFIHHFIVFILEQFSFRNFGILLLKTLLTSSFTVILIVFGLQLFVKRKSNA